MEVVRVFNNELSSLYEVKPPISKAKMTQITKSAIKGIKFYKHIVQSVEKFIQKCRPEYKVPGLYVVDSIVRQSRHQFGSDKDVFGPRFVKNITTTFQHLFKCAEDDRPKIIRVLNLWQKNAVFPIDVIQPLLDMGHPNTSNEWPDPHVDISKDSPAVKSKEELRHKSSDPWKNWGQGSEEPMPDNKTYAEMSAKNLEKFNKAEMSNAVKEEEASHSSMYKNQIKLEKNPEETVIFNKKLLDFDYGDEEDEEEVKNEESHLSTQPNALALSMAQNFLTNPDLLRHFEQVAASTMQQSETLKDMNIQSHQPKPDNEANYSQEMQSSPQHPGMPTIPFPENSSLLQFQFDKNGVPYQTQPPLPMMEPLNMDAAYPPVMQSGQHLLQNSQGDEDERVMFSMPGEPPLPPQDFDERQIMLPVEERGRKERSRSRSGSRSRGRGSRRRSRSRSPRRKRSRSRSHSRKNRSRSRERERIREKERERERERERRRKGIPPIKKGCVSVCSTTLWLGHVPKCCSEVDISDTFGQFGTILSIDMIPPRGCAYVVMDRRQDGYRALQKLKNVKLQGSSIKMAWAPGKGVKGKEYKDYWEVDLGVSYVPYDKIKEDPVVLDLLEEGGFIDEDSLPEHLKALRKQPDGEKNSYTVNNKAVSEANASFSNIQTTPNMVPPPIIPPTSVNIPMVLPHLMQPQFGLHLPGMLPPQAMVMQVPMGIPPPAPMLMVQQQSQGILSNQPLSMVGGVPQIVSRSIPPATSALSNLKNAVQAETALPSAPVPPSTGDATPTEEEGTNVSSPSVQMSIPGSASVPNASTQPVVSMAQFNQILGLNATRPMLSVPPPVSTAGTPIPYPPPNMGFNFPPPGMRPHGQAHTLPPNPQFPWMQKQVGSPFTDADSSQSTASIRPVPPPQPGMPVHMFGNRPTFHDSQSSNVNSSPMKDPHKGRDNVEQKSDVDGTTNRNISPGHHEKMIQEMVISTDDESSMDIEYPRNDMPTGPCYPGVPDFPRTPMNMQRMRGPPGSMPPGPRFRGMHVGTPFPMRMSGPRGMGGPGMHNRMEMDFSPHHGSRGPRMPMGPHGPHRNDMHPPHDGRDWYPRDFEGPSYERERDTRYQDDWGREPWEHEGDERHNSRDRDETRRDDHRESWVRERPDNSKPTRDVGVTKDKNVSAGKPRDKNNKSKASKSLMDELLQLRSYQRGRPLVFNKSNRNEQSKDKPPKKDDKSDSNQNQNSEPNMEQSNNDKDIGNEQNVITKKEKDREARKRSRWGRTLSEEREFQQQKHNEIELKRCEVEQKFQSYEQSHAAQQPPQSTVDLPVQNPDETSKEQHVDVDVSGSEIVESTHSTVDISVHSEVDIPMHNKADMPVQAPVELPVQAPVELPVQAPVELPVQPPVELPVQPPVELSVQPPVELPVQPPVELPVQPPVELPVQSEQSVIQEDCKVPVQNSPAQNSSEHNVITDSKVPTNLCTEMPQSEPDNLCNVIDNISETITESNTSRSENMVDLNIVNGVTNNTSNENSAVADDVITNNTSLVSTES